MAREVFIAMFQNLASATRARRDLEERGVPAAEIEISSRERGDTVPEFWDSLYLRQPQYLHHVEDGGALLAVRAEGGEYDGIASILLRHDLRTRTELPPDKTSESARVRRYAIDASARVPLNS